MECEQRCRSVTGDAKLDKRKTVTLLYEDQIGHHLATIETASSPAAGALLRELKGQPGRLTGEFRIMPIARGKICVESAEKLSRQ